ncbi:MAG: MlaD family protein, partial [Actinomycetota bacterium]|nr:MlaD family protein [Actinomycetota bacterium]
MTRSPSRLVAAVVGLALAGGIAGCGAFSGDERKTLTASFDRAVGLYVKSDVRILGVRIGEVTDIVPEGDDVRVEMAYDAKYDIPADAQALVVAPSIVSDRYVQLTPVFTGGPVLEDKAVLAKDRTAVPVELDQIYA